MNRLKDKYGFSRNPSAAAIGRLHFQILYALLWVNNFIMLAGLGININFAPMVDLA